MDRRPLSVLLVLGLAGIVPGAADAASIDSLLAQAPNGTLTDEPAAVAQTPKGTLSDTPTASGTSTEGSRSGGSSSSSGSAPASEAATATALPFTGSDPRVTMMLGLAAILVGAGLRLRTGDARDF